MSLGQDFLAGFQTTSGARERKREREEKIEQEQLRKQFELDRDAERYRQEDLGRRAGFDNQTNQRIGGEDFAREQSASGYEFSGSEKQKDRTLTSTEAAADRALRQKLQDDTLNQAAKQFATKTDFDYQNMGLMAGLKNRELEARNDPANLSAQLNAERLAKLKRENADASSTPTAPTAPGATKPRSLLSTQDTQAFMWAKANPNSPQAAQILERLGMK